MAQDINFVDYAISQLQKSAEGGPAGVEVQHKFNAVSISYLGQLVGLIVNNTVFLQFQRNTAAAILPGVKPLQPLGVDVESQFFPVPLSWLADTEQLALCLNNAVIQPTLQRASA